MEGSYFKQYQEALAALMAVSRALEDKQRECDLLRIRIDALLAAREGDDDEAE